MLLSYMDEKLIVELPFIDLTTVKNPLYMTVEKPKQENSRWEKEPENVEMKLWDVGKDQVETGSLKDLLDGSDEDLEEWKD